MWWLMASTSDPSMTLSAEIGCGNRLLKKFRGLSRLCGAPAHRVRKSLPSVDVAGLSGQGDQALAQVVWRLHRRVEG